MIKWLRGILNNRKYKKILKRNKQQDTIYVDLGSTSIKMCFQNELINFKASIRKANNENEITPAMKNFIKVGNDYYIIGEANKSNEIASYKAERDNIDILILYGIKLLKSKGIKLKSTLKINILVPFTELKFKDILSKKINGVYKLEGKEITLVVNKLFVEGESSAIYFKEKYKVEGNLIVCNIGGKTSDINIINSNDNIEKTMSVNMGVQALLSEIVRYTKAPSSNILSTWLSDGYKFTKEEMDHIKKVNREFINNIYNDLIANSIKLVNPNNTKILFTGGGSLILKDSIIEELKEYKIKILNKYESIFSDLLGAMILSNETLNIENIDNNKFTDTKQIEEKEESEIQEIKENKIVNLSNCRKTKYELFVELFEAGFSSQEIMEKTNMAKQTLKNYKSKYTKELRTS